MQATITYSSGISEEVTVLRARDGFYGEKHFTFLHNGKVKTISEEECTILFEHNCKFNISLRPGQKARLIRIPKLVESFEGKVISLKNQFAPLELYLNSVYEIESVSNKTGLVKTKCGNHIPFFCLEYVTYEHNYKNEDTLKMHNGVWYDPEYEFISDLTGKRHDKRYLKIAKGGVKATKKELLDNDYKFCVDLDKYSAVYFYSAIGGSYYSTDSRFYTSLDGTRAHESDFEWSDRYRFISDLNTYCYSSETVYVNDLDEYWHEGNENLYFWESRGRHYSKPDPNNTDHLIAQYHRSASLRDLSNGAEFRIGFEIEKTDFNGLDCQGEHVGSFTLFKGFETDSSCGVEAITNILPLDDSEGRSQVFDWIDEAEWVINSKSDERCSCHTNISVKDIDSCLDLISMIKPYMCVFFTKYKNRLKNRYCSNNINIDLNGEFGHYSCINMHNRHIEIRLPSAISNTQELKDLYDMTYFMLSHAKAGTSIEEYIKLFCDKFSFNEEFSMLSSTFYSFLFNTGSLQDSISSYLPSYALTTSSDLVSGRSWTSEYDSNHIVESASSLFSRITNFRDYRISTYTVDIDMSDD